MKVAIITPFNDIEGIEGGSRKSIKKEISYYEQFLILYESIQENWKDADFDFYFVVLHSIPFSQNRQKLIQSLAGVDVRKVTYKYHETKIKPCAYQIDLDCDFRLILDVDMYALSPPKFNFSVDAQAMYGGNKYNNEQWAEICKHIGARFPCYRNLKTEKGNATDWNGKEHFEYQLRRVTGKLFPYFNNGAILVRNSLAKKIGDTWDEYRIKYIDYLDKAENGSHQLSIGQNIIGIAIDNCVEQWEPFEPGFNIIIQEKFERGREMLDLFDPKDISLFHYINVPKGSIYESLVLNKYREIRARYFQDEQD